MITAGMNTLAAIGRLDRSSIRIALRPVWKHQPDDMGRSHGKARV